MPVPFIGKPTCVAESASAPARQQHRRSVGPGGNATKYLSEWLPVAAECPRTMNVNIDELRDRAWREAEDLGAKPTDEQQLSHWL